MDVELEHEVVREALAIAFDLFVQAFGDNAEERGEIGSKQQLVPSKDQDRAFDALGGNGGAAHFRVRVDKCS